MLIQKSTKFQNASIFQKAPTEEKLHKNHNTSEKFHLSLRRSSDHCAHIPDLSTKLPWLRLCPAGYLRASLKNSLTFVTVIACFISISLPLFFYSEHFLPLNFGLRERACGEHLLISQYDGYQHNSASL